MQITSPLRFFLLAGSLFVANSSFADTALTFTDTSPQGETRSSSIQIHGNTVRTSDSTSQIYTLFDSEERTMYTINPEVKQYMKANIVIIKQKMVAAMAQQEKMKAQMKEHLSKIPEEQRKVYEQRMEIAEQQAKATPPKIEMQASEKTETIQGLSCKTVTASIERKPIKETCIAKEGIDEKDMTQLNAMFSFMEEITVETAKIRGIAAPDVSSMPGHQDGLAIKTQVLPTGIKNELTAISTDALDNKDFSVPEGYTLFEPQAAQQTASPVQSTQEAATTAPAAK